MSYHCMTSSRIQPHMHFINYIVMDESGNREISPELVI